VSSSTNKSSLPPPPGDMMSEMARKLRDRKAKTETSLLKEKNPQILMEMIYQIFAVGDFKDIESKIGDVAKNENVENDLWEDLNEIPEPSEMIKRISNDRTERKEGHYYVKPVLNEGFRWDLWEGFEWDNNVPKPNIERRIYVRMFENNLTCYLPVELIFKRKDGTTHEIKIWGIFDNGANTCEVTDDLLGDDLNNYGENVPTALRFGGYVNRITTYFCRTPIEKRLYNNTYVLLGQFSLLARIIYEWRGTQVLDDPGIVNLISYTDWKQNVVKFEEMEEDFSKFAHVGKIDYVGRNTDNE